MNSPRTAIVLAATFCACQAAAQTDHRTRVQDLRPLLRQAIEHGAASGILVGEAAAFIRRRFGAEAPIEIDVRTVETLHEPGCRQLEVTTRQANVSDKGTPEPRQLTYRINHCLDDRTPERTAP